MAPEIPLRGGGLHCEVESSLESFEGGLSLNSEQHFRPSTAIR